jgi:hypothetical protein
VARMLCAEQGMHAPDSRLGRLDGYRFLAENESHRQGKILQRYSFESEMQVCERSLRPIEDTGKIYFEKN